MGQCGNERKPCPVQMQSAGHGLGGSVAAQTSTSATAGKHSSNSTQAANAEMFLPMKTSATQIPSEASSPEQPRPLDSPRGLARPVPHVLLSSTPAEGLAGEPFQAASSISSASPGPAASAREVRSSGSRKSKIEVAGDDLQIQCLVTTCFLVHRCHLFAVSSRGGKYEV